MYWVPPTAEELKSEGSMYVVEDFPEPFVEVWEENWYVLTLFQIYRSQWRMGPGGPTGLDFNVFQHALDRKGVSADEYEETILMLRVVEAAAIEEIYRK